MQYAKILFQSLCKALARPNGRKLRRKEKVLESKMFSDLQMQKKYILGQYKDKLSKKNFKGLSEDLNNLFDDLSDEDMIDDIVNSSKDAMTLGAQYQIGKQKLGRLGIAFDLEHELAVQYLQTDRPLVLAKMKDTTKELIKPILADAVDKGLSPSEVEGILSDQFAFSRTRSLMIAVNEIGHAYEYGNWIPMKDTIDKGYTVKKKWQTVNDDNVTPECEANQSMGWIAFDEEFDSGDDQAPRDSNPRCRCTTLYETSE